MPRRPHTSRQTRLVLASLAAEPSRWWHGYDLGQSLSLKSGTLYPILARLSDDGYLEGRWAASEVSARPPRHLYRLTASGRNLAAERAAEAGDAAAPDGQGAPA